jgi:hypothetical protein
MNAGRNKILAKAVVCALLVTAATKPAVASIPTNTDVAWIGIAIGAIGAGIGVGIYYAVHHNRSLTGCAASGPNGLELENHGDQQTYSLVGAVSAIKPGDRIRVSGKKVKKSTGPSSQFLVEQLSKDFGPCSAKRPMP